MKRIKFQTSLPDTILKDVDERADEEAMNRTQWLEQIVRKELYPEGIKNAT